MAQHGVLGPAGQHLGQGRVDQELAADLGVVGQFEAATDQREVLLGATAHLPGLGQPDQAVETLRALPAEPEIDIAFIDADKVGYPLYYEEIVPRLRPGGLVVLDNVFLGGRVLDPAYQEEHHLAMRRLNDFIAADDRVDAVMLPVRDGVTLARKR
ncbi:O-methyltransferase [Kitasatospora sp. NPDC052896]|uniref:O-methyltransferase n=1 Tax=Kitasatospora sp. NPDC052896 TaxID=3364061 RepID=UPI0037C89A78